MTQAAACPADQQTPMGDLVAELRRGLRGTATAAPPPRYSTDFGGLRRKVPAVLVRATCEDDICHTLAVARAAGVPVSVRGAGHSCNGQTLSGGGIVLENYAPGTPAEMLDGTTACLPARASWRGVEQSLNAAGRQAPVLADYLDLSVGGTLSVGGIGITSHRHGFQVDTVRRARLILPDGRAVWCSGSEEPDLFRLALAGLGQVGVLEAVEMATEPCRPFTHVVQRRHSDAQDLLAWLIAQATAPVPPDHLAGFVRHGACASEYGTFGTDEVFRPDGLAPEARPKDGRDDVTTYRDYPAALHSRRDVWLDSFPDHLRLWVDYVVDAGAAPRFLTTLEGIVAGSALRDTLQVTYLLLMRRPAGALAFPFLPAPPGECSVGFGLYVMASHWQPTQIARSLQALSTLLDACVAMGGRPYLYGTYDLGEAHRSALYGPALEEIRTLRARTQAAFLNTGGVPGPSLDLH